MELVQNCNLLVLIIALNVYTVLASRYCTIDTDCEVLGTVYCIKSMCGNYGVCGCRRGFAMRYTGSEQNFQCAKIKKIGESCDTEGAEGVCGADNSKCENGTCRCIDDTYESRYGGERCMLVNEAGSGESCGDGIGSCAGFLTCTTKLADWGVVSEQPNPAESANYPLDYTPRQCACGEGNKLTLPNGYDDAPFMGRKQPVCQTIKLGDMCVTDRDCINIREPNGAGGWDIQGGICETGVCVCANTSYVQDITGEYCAQALTYGDDCSWNNAFPGSDLGICNGEEGLICGDPCDQMTFTVSTNHTCTCDPGWSDSGSACSKVQEGASCNGDFNCKSMDDNAICVEGKCADDGAMLTYSVLLLVTAFMIRTLV